jgi:glycosyltransferase involved in cell wall biosynthesis
MLDSYDSILHALHDPLLDGMFHRAGRIGVESAWYGHVPFGYWIVGQIRPHMLVELGTHNGVSYASFCDAVVDARLPTRCFAVDTWQGDEHAGHYGEEVYADFRQFHDERYSRFSSLLRMTFDTALDQLPDGSIDLLHIDGAHTYDAVSHDFTAWQPKLSERAVVLFHDTNVRERDFGVWRLWHELRQRHGGFEFLHAHGLGILAVGKEAPPAVAALCALSDGREIAAVRERFALLGERWHFETVLRLREAQLARRHAELVQQKDQLGQQNDQLVQQHGQLVQLNDELTLRLVDDAARAQRQIAERLDKEKAIAEQLMQSSHFIAALQRERDIILGSTLWRATEPIRIVARTIPAPARRLARRLLRPREWLARRPPRIVVAARAPAEPAVVTSDPTPGTNVVFISGESHTPGHHYRVLRSAAAASAIGYQVRWFTIEESGAHLQEIAQSAVVVIWRAPWSDALAALLHVARAAGSKIVYDVDDLMFLPQLARPDIIDGIRSQKFDQDDVAAMFSNVRQAMLAADLCTCPTNEIALLVRAYQMPAVVLPNGFDADLHRRSRVALRRRRLQGATAPIRIGYAAGSRTHQKDFAVVADALAHVLRNRPQCRLTLFRSETAPLVDIDEYHSLDAVSQQIEWRPMCSLQELPDELARFDVNIAPLEVGNPFCEAKSELKYFEAALVDVCTVASPTGPFRRSVRDGETGFLAATSDDWYRHLVTLVDDADLRRKIGHAAYLDVIWTYGPQRRAESVASLIQQLQGGPSAARAMELELLRHAARPRRQPTVPVADTVFHEDRLGEAEVSVVIPVHNYAQYVVEALESVRRQTADAIDLVIVDDASTDDSLGVVTDWAQRNAERFNRISVLSNRGNAGLALTRNVGIDAAETPFIFLLDADNRILPDCCNACLQAMRTTQAAFAYPQIRCFGDSDQVIGTPPFEPNRLAGGNYIDAMAMVAKWAWAAVGGYNHLRHGWEDYDFWCSLVEHGCWGIAVPTILAEYRVHGASMLHTTTDVADNKRELIRELEQRHPWLGIPSAADVDFS